MNFRLITVLLLTILTLQGCTKRINKVASPPEDLISRDSMINIMVDLRLMDAALVYEQKKGTVKVNDIKYYLHNSVLEKYQVTREQFQQSFAYYQADLKVIDGMFADVITKLSKLKSETEYK